MPELPEVETTRRGVLPHALGERIAEVVVREPRLRWPVPGEVSRLLPGARIEAIDRRGKYLLFRTTAGTLIGHLGMSGSIRVCSPRDAPARHDHLDIRLANGKTLRYNDPRRFGCMLWTLDDPAQHPLLRRLGPEPLEEDFTPAYLHRRARGRKAAVKPFIMDSRIVVGVGNIYANEALFLAGIRPGRAAGRLSRAHCGKLVAAIQSVLTDAVREGGTTLRDFVSGEGQPGYFVHHLKVYARARAPCPACGAKLRQTRQAQRSTVYCPKCQK